MQDDNPILKINQGQVPARRRKKTNITTNLLTFVIQKKNLKRSFKIW